MEIHNHGYTHLQPQLRSQVITLWDTQTNDGSGEDLVTNIVPSRGCHPKPLLDLPTSSYIFLAMGLPKSTPRQTTDIWPHLTPTLQSIRRKKVQIAMVSGTGNPGNPPALVSSLQWPWVPNRRIICWSSQEWIALDKNTPLASSGHRKSKSHMDP